MDQLGRFSPMGHGRGSVAVVLQLPRWAAMVVSWPARWSQRM
jgi:hypothetical protein